MGLKYTYFPLRKGNLLEGGKMLLPSVPVLGIFPLLLPVKVPPTHNFSSVLSKLSPFQMNTPLF